MRFRVGDIVRTSKSVLPSIHYTKEEGKITSVVDTEHPDHSIRVSWEDYWLFCREDELRLVRRPSARIIDQFLED